MTGEKQGRNIIFREQDIAEADLAKALEFGVVAWDTETSGLNWQSERIAICQLCFPDDAVILIKINQSSPQLLCSLLTNKFIQKVFHYAIFDLRFLIYNWKILPEKIACTKIASKLLSPQRTTKHSLKDLLLEHLSVSIDKDEQASDWFTDCLSESQISYAAKDVLYLLPLLKSLESKLQRKGLLELEHACFDHIPARVQLDVLGYEDIYSY